MITIYTTTSWSPADKQRLFDRSSCDYETLKTEIKPLVEAVRLSGDGAILRKYRSRQIPINSLRVTQEEFASAAVQVSPAFKRAVAEAIQAIRSVCLVQKKQLQKKDFVSLKNGTVKVWRRWQPIESIGVYVPGGKANYPSSLLMSVIPAQIAGCKEIIVCVPPSSSGQIPAEVLYAAQKLGVAKVFKVGGPQAIAALAYGTTSVPSVQKIVGPGNQYVTAAKLLLYPLIDIDMPAGPSENLIIADDSANPTFVAADLITDLEHGADSTGILITPSKKFAQQVRNTIKKLVKTVPTRETITAALSNYSSIIVTETMDEAITLSNEYAPEHLQIMTKNPRRVAQKIKNAGSVFIGPWSSKSSGDYATGANHVLPTGKMATTVGSLSVESFGKYIEFQEVSKVGLQSLRSTIETFAEVENLPAHRLSTSIRFQ